MAIAFRNIPRWALVGAIGLWLLGTHQASAQPARSDTLMSKAEQPEEEDDREEAVRWEEFPNPRPFLSPEQVPGYALSVNQVNRGFYRNKPPQDSFYEHWVKPTPGSKYATFIKITLYATKNREKALKAARVLFHATNDKKQPLNAIGKPNPGSFTGQPIGDDCWAYVVGMRTQPKGHIDTSFSLVIIKGRYLFKLQVTGPGETGAGTEDRAVEDLAKAIVEKLKTWQPPP